MKCERCHQKEASVHLSRIVNGKKSEQHLCQSCASETGADSPFQSFYNPFLSGSPFGGSIFNPTGGIPAFGGSGTGAGRDLACPSCGTTFEAFRKSGLFGCSQCYETFREKLDPVLRRVQGSTRHIGRPVCRTKESQEQLVLKERLASLRKNLAAAVEREAYEEAARLRDEVRAVDARICDLSSQAALGGTGPTGAGDGSTPGDGGGKGAGI